MPAEVHRQREAAPALIAQQRAVGHTRCARGLWLAVSEKAANRIGLGFRDPAAADARHARVLAFLSREFLGELHANFEITKTGWTGATQ